MTTKIAQIAKVIFASIVVSTTLCAANFYECVLLQKMERLDSHMGEGPAWVIAFSSWSWFILALPIFIEIYRRFLVSRDASRFLQPLWLVVLTPIIPGVLANVTGIAACGFSPAMNPYDIASDLYYGIFLYGAPFALVVYLVGVAITPWLSRLNPQRWVIILVAGIPFVGWLLLWYSSVYSTLRGATAVS